MKYFKHKAFFTEALLKWNIQDNHRVMPWKNERDPYKIWISEIILQQTRVQQGLEYYNRFITTYPTVQHIAEAEESKIFKSWEGLGYYSRCKNIIASAKYICNELNSEFPDTYESILQLKGIGSYTASAIASFAYNLPYAVLDVNVFRVLSRFFAIRSPIDSTEGKKIYSTLANKLLHKQLPGVYNQVIMDFGSTICKPKLPLCSVCPLNQKCLAYLKGLVTTLPIKNKFITRRTRWMYYLLIECNNQLYVRKRVTKDIWQNLNEFVLIETDTPVSIAVLQASKRFKEIFKKTEFTITSISKIYKQQLSHQTITGQFLTIRVNSCISIDNYRLIPISQLELLPFPKFITAYLKD